MRYKTRYAIDYVPKTSLFRSKIWACYIRDRQTGKTFCGKGKTKEIAKERAVKSQFRYALRYLPVTALDANDYFRIITGAAIHYIRDKLGAVSGFIFALVLGILLFIIALLVTRAIL